VHDYSEPFDGLRTGHPERLFVSLRVTVLLRLSSMTRLSFAGSHAAFSMTSWLRLRRFTMARLEEYANKFKSIQLERRDGILQMRLHTDGGTLL
jgi:hypothetical protein